MPVFSLGEELIFPHPVLREPDGLMAFNGDLSVERLLLAYRWGIFPWYHDDQPLLWWWLAPRLMLKPQEVYVSHSLKKVLERETFTVRMNTCFEEVMEHCAHIRRKGQKGTWITDEMVEAYTRLHGQGRAHSVEVFDQEGLAGGLYGVSLGHIFFGESMFALRTNASKVAFVHLARHLEKMGFEWIDCQQDTPHMRSLGGYLVEENSFLDILRHNQLHILRNGHLRF